MKKLLGKVWKKEQGFSLIELIIVIAILAIIAAIAVPNLLDNIRRANEGTDESNAKLIADSVATAIAQNPNWEGTEFVDEVLDGAYADSDFDDDVMTAATAILSTGIPTIKASSYGTPGGNFQVTLTGAGVITVESDTGTVLFPAP